MRILFICSGNNSFFEITPFIFNQSKSIERKGHEVDFFAVKGKGIKGYLKNVRLLRNMIMTNEYNILHAHYTFNGLLTLLTFPKTPVVVSYMGTDTYGDYDINGKLIPSSIINIIISKLIQPFINAIIVKSPNLSNYIYIKRKLYLIPNGVDFINISELSMQQSREYLKLPLNKKIVLFLGDKKNKRKNYQLFKDALDYVSRADIISLTPYPVKSENLFHYYLAADVIVLTSFNEGSPNVVKEAMASNRPVVSTDVGDVRWLFGSEQGHFLSSFEPEDVAEKIKMALKFQHDTNGRERLRELGLDAETVAGKIIEVYDQVLDKTNNSNK